MAVSFDSIHLHVLEMHKPASWKANRIAVLACRLQPWNCRFKSSTTSCHISGHSEPARLFFVKRRVAIFGSGEKKLNKAGYALLLAAACSDPSDSQWQPR